MTEEMQVPEEINETGETVKAVLIDPKQFTASQVAQLNSVVSEKADPIKEIAKLKKKFSGLKITGIDDKAGYEEVRLAIGVLRPLRTSIEKKRKELNQYPMQLKKNIDDAAKVLREKIEEVETPLQSMKDKIDDEIAAKKREEEEALEAKINKRILDLKNAGAEFDEKYYSIGEISINVVDVRTLKDDAWDDLLGKVEAKAQEIRAAKEAAEAKEKEDARRKNQMFTLGMQFDGENFFYSNIDGDKKTIPLKDVLKHSDFETLFEAIKAEYEADKKERAARVQKENEEREAEKKKQDEQAAEMKRQKDELEKQKKELEEAKAALLSQKISAREVELNSIGLMKNMAGSFRFSNSFGWVEVVKEIIEDFSEKSKFSQLFSDAKKSIIDLKKKQSEKEEQDQKAREKQAAEEREAAEKKAAQEEASKKEREEALRPDKEKCSQYFTNIRAVVETLPNLIDQKLLEKMENALSHILEVVGEEEIFIKNY